MYFCKLYDFNRSIKYFKGGICFEDGGNASKGIEMIADGAVDLAAYAAGVMAVLDEHLLIGLVPWTFNNYQDARRIIDSTGGEVYFKFWRAFGADPVAMSWSEAFTAIQQGTIDGQENGFSVTNSAKVNEIQQYMTVWNYTYENYLFVANTEIFESLEPKTQELIRAKAKEACEWGRDLVENDEENLKEKFIKGGMELTVLTPEQLKPFQDKVQGVRHELMEKYGPEACEAFQMH